MSLQFIADRYVLQVLVKNNLAIDAVDSKGTSPLMFACTHGNVAATSALTRCDYTASCVRILICVVPGLVRKQT